VRERLRLEGKALKGFAFWGYFRSEEMASCQLAISSAVLDSFLEDRRHKASGS